MSTAIAHKEESGNVETKDARAQRNNVATASNGVRCEIDGLWVHSISVHLKHEHPSMSLSEYRLLYPEAPIESAYIRELRIKRERERAGASIDAATSATVAPFPTPAGGVIQPLHKVFGLREQKSTQNARGEQIMCPVLGAPDPEIAMYLGEVDENYVHDPEQLKDILLATLLNIPMLAWGFHGTGKTTMLEQFFTRTNRPFIRVQHTVSTEEAHILGQYVVKTRDGEKVMEFEPGPLAVAMRFGLIYLADEYDFALPSVTSVYQPVLEGKSLLIKEAPPEWRMVKPHPNFRFFATGNTNGSGDETGLYQGTQIMNAANYSRFGLTLQIGYKKPDIETNVVAKQAGILPEDARKLVNFANNVRESYAKGEISVTVSPRELINAAKIGLAKGGAWRAGLQKSYINRLSSTDRKAVDDFAQRIFGGES